jgi:hypothetical protein
MASEHSRRSSTGGRSSTKDNRTSEDGRMAHLETLIEKRRLQNRISQRNYRNKLRGRIEHLEALVSAHKKESDPRQFSPNNISSSSWGHSHAPPGTPMMESHGYPALGTSPNLVASSNSSVSQSSGSKSPEENLYSSQNFHVPQAPELFSSQPMDHSQLLGDLNSTINPLNLIESTATGSSNGSPGEHKPYMSLDLSHDGNINIPTAESSMPMMSTLPATSQFNGLGDSNPTHAYGLSPMQLHQLLCKFDRPMPVSKTNMTAANGGYNLQNGESMHPQTPVAYVPVFVVGGESMPDISPYVYVPMTTNANGSMSEMRPQPSRKGSMVGSPSRALVRREKLR